MSLNAEFKARVLARERLLGAFFKTPHPIAMEVMGLAGFDFVVLDAEHAPFDRSTIDTCLIAARSLNMPVIVRIPDPSWSLNTLDAGAAGLMFPHVETAAQAATLARLCHYHEGGGPGARGFAGTSRPARYSKRPFAEHLAETRDEVTLIAQIEDPDGVVNAASIADTDDIDALFVGRADLAVSHGLPGFFAEEVGAMTEKTLGVSGSATGLYCAPGEPIDRWESAGGSLFVVGSDHSLMLSGGKALREAFDAAAH
jgi:2-keto-3-deoxy-L-rhamnonate aldolase RhmA